MRVIEVKMETHRNEVTGEMGDPRENPPTNGIVRHDSHMRKSGDQECLVPALFLTPEAVLANRMSAVGHTHVVIFPGCWLDGVRCRDLPCSDFPEFHLCLSSSTNDFRPRGRIIDSRRDVRADVSTVRMDCSKFCPLEYAGHRPASYEGPLLDTLLQRFTAGVLTCLVCFGSSTSELTPVLGAVVGMRRLAHNAIKTGHGTGDCRTWLDYSPRRTGFHSRLDHSRIFASGNRPDDAAGLQVFSGSPASPALSFRLCSIPRFTLIGSQNLGMRRHFSSRRHLVGGGHSLEEARGRGQGGLPISALEWLKYTTAAYESVRFDYYSINQYMQKLVWKTANAQFEVNNTGAFHHPQTLENCAANWPLLLFFYKGAVVTERLDYSPPTKANRDHFPAESVRIFSSGNRARRWLLFVGGYSRGYPPPPLNSGIAPFSRPQLHVTARNGMWPAWQAAETFLQSLDGLWFPSVAARSQHYPEAKASSRKTCFGIFPRNFTTPNHCPSQGQCGDCRFYAPERVLGVHRTAVCLPGSPVVAIKVVGGMRVVIGGKEREGGPETPLLFLSSLIKYLELPSVAETALRRLPPPPPLREAALRPDIPPPPAAKIPTRLQTVESGEKGRERKSRCISVDDLCDVTASSDRPYFTY
ncbi:hypothetical protein PR048_002349 [Dryococelus australis]|uniref:Uncharacterized protein n=1 Tax=Dryococelus australis TaxID=614101 RepID=A0ABQ9IJX8_9NEOP|nr:hypothetical protein PR048_002349 [Dryococelus australis]